MSIEKPKGTLRREITNFTIDAGVNGFGDIDSIIETALINHGFDLDITPIKDVHTGRILKEEIKVFHKEIIPDQNDIPKCNY